MPDQVIAAENAEQFRYWNEDAGPKWVRHQQRLDRLMEEVRDGLLSRAAVGPRDRILDVGCGAGDTTLALSRLTGPDGTVTGADISKPLLAVAQQRCGNQSNVRFLLADVQTHRFAESSFDLVTSRFGVMFFSDTLAAFGNLATAMRSGARMCFAAWARPADSPWFAFASAAATAQLGPAAPASPDGPGPFAFSDSERVVGLLSSAGFTSPKVETVGLGLLVDGTRQDAAELCAQIGPVPRIVTELGGTPADVSAIKASLAEAFGSYATPTGIRVPGSVHFFSAEKP